MPALPCAAISRALEWICGRKGNPRGTTTKFLDALSTAPRYFRWTVPRLRGTRFVLGDRRWAARRVRGCCVGGGRLRASKAGVELSPRADSLAKNNQP